MLIVFHLSFAVSYVFATQPTFFVLQRNDASGVYSYLEPKLMTQPEKTVVSSRGGFWPWSASIQQDTPSIQPDTPAVETYKTSGLTIWRNIDGSLNIESDDSAAYSLARRDETPCDLSAPKILTIGENKSPYVGSVFSKGKPFLHIFDCSQLEDQDKYNFMQSAYLYKDITRMGIMELYDVLNPEELIDIFYQYFQDTKMVGFSRNSFKILIVETIGENLYKLSLKSLGDLGKLSNGFSIKIDHCDVRILFVTIKDEENKIINLSDEKSPYKFPQEIKDKIFDKNKLTHYEIAVYLGHFDYTNAADKPARAYLLQVDLKQFYLFRRALIETNYFPEYKTLKQKLEALLKKPS